MADVNERKPFLSNLPNLPNLPESAKEPITFSMPKWVWWLWYGFLVVWFIITFLLIITGTIKSGFENKYYDPFGTGIRHYVSRDDTGSVQTSLEERQYGSKPLKMEPLTSTPESPNFSEYYGIEANLKDGSVMIERENFENSALDLEQLEKANKGL
jgi:hypothetical protein